MTIKKLETIEDYQNALLEIEKQRDEFKLKITEQETKYNELKSTYETTEKSLNESREINSQLALKISTQTLTPKEEPKPQQPEKKVLSFDDILNQL